MPKYALHQISKLGKVVTGKTPSTERPDYYDGDFLFITPTELHDGYRVKRTQKTLSFKGMSAIKSNTISGKSVLVGCIGWDMGNVALCDETCATNQQINSITQISDAVNPSYLYYWLSSKKDYLRSIASVTRTPILSKSTFEQISVPLPERSYQDRVAALLETIDESILANNNINDNLPMAA